MSHQTLESDRPDIVLVTIDCWRADTVFEMPNLRAMAANEEYQKARGISQSAATNGAIPPLLASQHSIQAYDRDGQVDEGTTSLPTVLEEQGYSTAGVIGSNPFTAKWVDHFDHFWNDGMRVSMDYSSPRYSTFDRAIRFLGLKQRVNASQVASRARNWYQSTQGPRFLWMHLMDIHGPYFPGLRGGYRVGLYRTYSTLFDYHLQNESSEQLRERLHTLYTQCVKQLDAKLEAVFEFIDSDAIVIVTGDHGEEFEHGNHGHARLYDECVTTPLFSKNLTQPLSGYDVRHLDLAPTLLAELGIEQPPDWEGQPVDGSVRDTFLSNHAPQSNRTYVGLRTNQYKFIKSLHDERWTVEYRELYDLIADPDEQTPVEDPAVTSELEQTVDSFLHRADVQLDVLRERTTGIDEAAEQRLKELGYV